MLLRISNVSCNMANSVRCSFANPTPRIPSSAHLILQCYSTHCVDIIVPMLLQHHIEYPLRMLPLHITFFVSMCLCLPANERSRALIRRCVCVCVSVNVREFRIDALIARISKWGTNPSEGRGDTFLLLPPSLSLLLSLASLIH